MSERTPRAPVVVGVVLAVAMASTTGAEQVLVGDRMDAAAVVAATPLVQGETVRAAVEMRIAAGFHVNANPPSEDFLIPTEISLVDARGLEIVQVFYPPALEKTFGFWPEPLRVYEGSTVAGVVLRVADDSEPGGRNIEFRVRYQACNDEACFAPAEATYVLPVEVARAGTESRQVESPLLDRAPFEDPS